MERGIFSALPIHHPGFADKYHHTTTSSKLSEQLGLATWVIEVVSTAISLMCAAEVAGQFVAQEQLSRMGLHGARQPPQNPQNIPCENLGP